MKGASSSEIGQRRDNHRKYAVTCVTRAHGCGAFHKESVSVLPVGWLRKDLRDNSVQRWSGAVATDMTAPLTAVVPLPDPFCQRGRHLLSRARGPGTFVGDHGIPPMVHVSCRDAVASRQGSGNASPRKPTGEKAARRSSDPGTPGEAKRALRGRRRRPGGRWVCWLCGWQRGRVRPRRCGGCGEADGRLRYAPWCGRTIFSKRRESPGIVRATRITPQPRSYFGDKRPAARPSRSPGCLRAPASANATRAERRQQRPLDSGLALSRGCGVRRLAARFCAVPALSRTGPSDTRTDSYGE